MSDKMLYTALRLIKYKEDEVKELEKRAEQIREEAEALALLCQLLKERESNV